MFKQLFTVALVAVAGLVAVLSLVGGPAQATSYTTLDHPALPCNLSEEAVANWGETSAHMPLACTYDE
jgi:hypothetical protein